MSTTRHAALRGGIDPVYDPAALADLLRAKTAQWDGVVARVTAPAHSMGPVDVDQTDEPASQEGDEPGRGTAMTLIKTAPLGRADMTTVDMPSPVASGRRQPEIDHEGACYGQIAARQAAMAVPAAAGLALLATTATHLGHGGLDEAVARWHEVDPLVFVITAVVVLALLVGAPLLNHLLWHRYEAKVAAYRVRSGQVEVRRGR